MVTYLRPKTNVNAGDRESFEGTVFLRGSGGLAVLDWDHEYLHLNAGGISSTFYCTINSSIEKLGFQPTSESVYNSITGL